MSDVWVVRERFDEEGTPCPSPRPTGHPYPSSIARYITSIEKFYQILNLAVELIRIKILAENSKKSFLLSRSKSW